MVDAPQRATNCGGMEPLHMQGGVNDAIQQAKMIQAIDRAILPFASKARARALKCAAR